MTISLTVMTPVAAVTPASPKRAVAASVTIAVAAMLTTLLYHLRISVSQHNNEDYVLKVIKVQRHLYVEHIIRIC